MFCECLVNHGSVLMTIHKSLLIPRKKIWLTYKIYITLIKPKKKKICHSKHVAEVVALGNL